MEKHSRNFIKLCVLGGLISMTMGQQSFQDATANRTDGLKRYLNLGLINSQPIVLPDGSSFNFKYVMNAQVATEVMNSSGFALHSGPILFQAGDGSPTLGLSSKDTSLHSKISEAGSSIFQASTDNICMLNSSWAKLSGNVYGFELTSSIDAHIGFGKAGPINSGIGIDAKFDSAQLDLDMRLDRMLNANSSVPLAAVPVTSTQTKTSLGLSLPLGAIFGGLDVYFSTPVSQVTRKGLALGLAGLTTAMDANSGVSQWGEWFTRVMDYNNEVITIYAGSTANVKAGDLYDVYPEKCLWSGTPCASELQGCVTGATPVGTIKIDFLGEEIASGAYTGPKPDFTNIGWKVKKHIEVAPAKTPAPATAADNQTVVAQ